MCVSLDHPRWLLEFFLDRPCNRLGSDTRPPLLWEVWCLNTSDTNALAERWQADAVASRADLLKALNLLAEGQKNCQILTSRAKCTRASIDDISALPPNPAALTACGKEVLSGYPIPSNGYCCPDKDELLWSGKNSSGSLPDTFQMARNFTDLSNNPALCGVLSGPFSSQAWASNIPPVRLYNSNVKVDVRSLGKLVPDGLGFWIAAWLGSQDPRIVFNNLKGVLPEHGAFQVCFMYDKRSINMQRSNYRCGVQSATCQCRGIMGPLFVTSQQAWDDCHVSVVVFDFNNSALQQRSLQAYNRYVGCEDSAFQCGEQGKAYRLGVIQKIWGGVAPTVYVVVLFGLLGAELWCGSGNCKFFSMFLLTGNVAYHFHGPAAH